jgi:thiamine transport system substrate-binding protein
MFPNSNALLDSLASELFETNPDIVMGLNNINTKEKKLDSLFIEFSPKNLRHLSKKIQLDKNSTLYPYAWTQLGFINSSDKIVNTPTTFGEMQDGIFKNKIIMPDPLSTDEGKAILLWSMAAVGLNGFEHFWLSVKNNLYKIPGSYDESFNMLLSNQAPIMIGLVSHTLSQSALLDSKRLSANMPSEGSFNYYFYCGIYKHSANLSLAQKFIEFCLSEEFQTNVSRGLWLYPVNENIKLSDQFLQLPISDKDYSTTLSSRIIHKNMKSWLNRWLKIMQKK